MEETFAQIADAAKHSPDNVSIDITGAGTITGKGVASTNAAISVCGGNVDQIIRSFGGVQGGSINGGLFEKVSSILHWSGETNEKMGHEFSNKVQKMKEFLSKLESFIKEVKEEEHEGLIDDLEPQVEKIKTAIMQAEEIMEKPHQLNEQIEKSNEAMEILKTGTSKEVKSGAISLGLSSVNRLDNLKGHMKPIVDKLKATKKGIKRMVQEYHNKTGNSSMKKHISKFMEKKHGGSYGGSYGEASGGASSPTDTLVDRLKTHREHLRDIVNKFIAAFSTDFGNIVGAMDKMSEELGKRIDYDEKTLAFFDTFVRMKEFVDANERNAKLHQYLLELNQNMQVDSKEVKDRFISLVRDLGARADALDPTEDTKKFSNNCTTLITDINKYNDEIRSLYDTIRKSGGASNAMNELFSTDSSRINISGLLNALEKMKIAVNKVWFYRNIAIFRSNLNQTNKEIATYSKDYTKSVGKAIGDAIAKINNEYIEIINNINDTKSGMGLEIDMYNEARPITQKISKEKLKMVYKWQCDARIGLYKTVEAIDLYLLHFTEVVTKNPDAVSDLQKLLSATRIVAKWYDEKAGDNLIRVFETLATTATGALVEDATIDAANFVST